MRFVGAFARFWWDFIVGDTPEIAVGALLVLGLAFLIDDARSWGTVVLPLAVAALLVASLFRGRDR
jgi:hypothetical protein